LVRFVKGTTAQFGGASGDVFSAICGMQISRRKIHSPADHLICAVLPKENDKFRVPHCFFLFCFLFVLSASRS